MTDQNKTYIPWIPVIELAVLAFTTLGTTITLFMHSDAKTEAFRKECLESQNEFRRESLASREEFRKEVLSLHKEMAQEMKDFHGKLISIEERNKAKS